MAFIIFPVLVLLMVIAVIISYNRLTGMKKKLESISKNILALHKKNFDLIKSTSSNIPGTSPEQNKLFEILHQQLTKAEANPARNLSTSTQYYRSIKSAHEEFFSNPGILSENSNQPDYIEFKNKELVLLTEMNKNVENYNLIVTQFNKALNQFPNNLLAGMAGWVPYEDYEF